jgi:hypothetical protein
MRIKTWETEVASLLQDFVNYVLQDFVNYVDGNIAAAKCYVFTL